MAGICIVPMNGKGQRFVDANFETPKPLIKACGTELFVWALASFLSGSEGVGVDEVVVATRPEIAPAASDALLRNGMEFVNVIAIPNDTDGAATTIAETIRILHLAPGHGPLISVDCDAVNVLPQTRSNDMSAGWVSVTSSDDPGFSYTLESAGAVVEIVEKRVVSNTAVSGIYCFPTVDSYVSAYSLSRPTRESGREHYLSDVVNKAIENGSHFESVSAATYLGLGTPESLGFATKSSLNELRARIFG